jgi:hypothetical protein
MRSVPGTLLVLDERDRGSRSGAPGHPAAPRTGETDVELATVALAWIAGSVLIVPLTGLAARFGLCPLVLAVARLRAAGREDDGAPSGLEEEVAGLAAAVERLALAVERAHTPAPGA